MNIKINDLHKFYGDSSNRVEVLKGVNCEVLDGEICVLLGPSGSGKSTLLNIIGGIEPATSGSVDIGNDSTEHMNAKQLTLYRRNHLGFVFQFYNLIPNLTAYENIEMASQLVKNPKDPADLLEAVGLTNRRDNFPAQLSGGEQQRISIARAIAKNPKLLLCDEPTGALDYETGKSILKLLQKLSVDEGMTVVIITHNSALTAMANRVIRLKNGKVVSNTVNESPKSIDLIEW